MADYAGAAQDAKTAYEQAANGDYAAAAQAAFDAAKKAGVEEMGCGGEVAGASLGGAAAGAAAGSAVLPPFGTLVGAAVGAIAGGAAAADACEGEAGVYKTGRIYDDVGFPGWRAGQNWTADKSADELARDKYIVGPNGLSLGTVLHMLRRAKELGAGVLDLRRIVRVLVGEKELQNTLRQQFGMEVELEPTTRYAPKLDGSASAEMMWVLNGLTGLRRGGFDAPSALLLWQGRGKEPKGTVPAAVAAHYAELQRLLANYEAQYSPTYKGKLRSILPRPKYKSAISNVQKAITDAARRRTAAALRGTTRSLSLEGSAGPLALVAVAGAAFWYFRGRK